MKPSFFIRSVVTALLSQQISKVNAQEKINAKLNCYFAVFWKPCGGEPNLSHRRTTSLGRLGCSMSMCVTWSSEAEFSDNLSGGGCSHFSPQKTPPLEMKMLENHSNMTADERKARIGSMHAWYCTFAPCELTEHSCFRPRWWVQNPKAAHARALGTYFWLLWLHSCMRTVHASPRTADMKWNSEREAVNVHFDVNECKLRPLREGHASRVQNRSWHCCSFLFCVKSTSAPLHSTRRKWTV